MAAILGYDEDCPCEHCGRRLKVGIVVSGLPVGIIGADCFNKLIKADRNRFSGSGRPGAAYLRQLAIVRERLSDDRMTDLGYRPSFFVFELAAPSI